MGPIVLAALWLPRCSKSGTRQRGPAFRTSKSYSTCSSRSPNANAPGHVSLRLDVDPPPQIRQIDGRFYHRVLASPCWRRNTVSRVPSLHRRYPASQLPPDPSATLTPPLHFPVSSVIGTGSLREFRPGAWRASPVASHVLVTVPPPNTPPEWTRVSANFASPFCLRLNKESSASGSRTFRGHITFTCVAAR